MSEISAESSTRPAEGGSPKEGYDYGTNYLEERKLVGRWPAPWPQIVSLIFLAAIFLYFLVDFSGSSRSDEDVYPLCGLYVHQMDPHRGYLDGLYF